MSNKKRAALLTMGLIIALAVLAWHSISLLNFGEELVFSRVKSAVEATGYVLEVKMLRGNPITGVRASDIEIRRDDGDVAVASDMEMNLSFMSLLRGKPKLSRLLLRGLKADVDTIMANTPSGGGAGGAPALDRLVLADAQLTSRWGDLAISRGDLHISEGAAEKDVNYRLNLRGILNEKPLSLSGKVNTVQGAATLSEGSLQWSGLSLGANGPLTSHSGAPDQMLTIELSGADIEELAAFVPVLGRTTIKGVFAGKVNLAIAPNLFVSGDITSPAGRVWRLPFNDFGAQIAYENNKITLKNIKGEVFGADVVGKADVELVPGSLPNLALDLLASNLETARAKEEFTFLEKFPLKVDFAAIKLAGPVNRLSGPITLSSSGFTLAGARLSNVDASASLVEARQINLSANATAFDEALLASGSIGLSDPYPINIDVNMPSVSLEEISPHYEQLDKLGLKGSGSVTAQLTGPAGKIRITGQASIPRISSGEYELHNLTADISYEDETLTLVSGRAELAGAEITATGVYDDKKLDFNGSLRNLDLTTLGSKAPLVAGEPVKGLVSGSWALSGTSSQPDVSFELTLPQLDLGRHASLMRASAKGRVDVNSKRVEIESVRAFMGEGEIEGSGELNLPSENSPITYAFGGKFVRLDPGQVNSLKDVLGDDCKGRVSGTYSVRSNKMGRPDMNIDVVQSTLVSKKGELSEIAGSASLTSGDLELRGVRACFYSGNLRLDGKVSNVLSKGSELPLDLRASIVSVDMGRIARVFSPKARGYQGLLVADIGIEGSTKKPAFKAVGSLYGVRAFGFFLPVIRMQGIHGDLSNIQMPNIEALVGRGVIKANAELSKGDEWGGSIEAVGKSVDVRSLTFSLDDEMRRGISGTLNFDFKGQGSLSNFQGGGSAHLPTLNVKGFKLTNVRAPFMVTDGFAMVEDSSANAYGGTVMAQGAKDLKESRWGGRLRVTSADLGNAFADILPDSVGRIDGSVNLSLSFGGDSTRTSMYDASGNIEVSDGQISGFSGAAALSKLTGGRPPRFKSAIGSFNIDSKTLYLMPGSRVAAPKGDPVFKYVMVDGRVPLDGEMNVSVVGNVNIRALNVFAGAVQGLMASGFEDTDSMLTNFLGGAITGLSRNEFRDVSMRVIGEPSAIDFKDVVVASQQKVQFIPEALADLENTKVKDQERIRLNLEFPVGPGADSGRSNGAAGQVGGQLIEQALKDLLNFQ